MLKKLTRATVAPDTHRPIKVLQFGDGHFLRGFADWAIDIMNEKVNFNGDVQVVRPLRKASSKKADNQEGLYHVALMGLQNGKVISESRLITCIKEFIDPYEQKEKYLKAAENPDLKIIISNTTESGIAFNQADDNAENMPESFPGKVTLLLYHRFRFFNGETSKGLIFLPCELVEKNGDALKSLVLRYSERWNLPPDFSHWVAETNTFCNTLVDRIVPGFPKDNINDILSKAGYADDHVVAAEPFHFWAIEGSEDVRRCFPADKAGLSVKFVKDLTPYRIQKVRILNGAHTAMTPVAYLKGLRTVKESVDDPYAGEFIRKAIFTEIIPTLNMPGDEVRKFANDVLERFQNPFIRHELKSIALNAISKFKVRVLPTILDYYKLKQQLPPNLIFSFAALIRFYKGEWKHEILPLNDSPEIIGFFSEVWKNTNPGHVAASVLSNTTLWGEDLTQIDGMVDKVTRALEELN